MKDIAQGLKWAFLTFGPAISPVLFFSSEAIDFAGSAGNTVAVSDGLLTSEKPVLKISKFTNQFENAFPVALLGSDRTLSGMLDKSVRYLKNREIGVQFVPRRDLKRLEIKHGFPITQKSFDVFVLSATGGEDRKT